MARHDQCLGTARSFSFIMLLHHEGVYIPDHRDVGTTAAP